MRDFWSFWFRVSEFVGWIVGMAFVAAVIVLLIWSLCVASEFLFV